MGKKKKEVMEKEKVTFIAGAERNGFKAADADRIFEILIPFAGYGFNKSHAAAYSVVAYHTAYLKANFPRDHRGEPHERDHLGGQAPRVHRRGTENGASDRPA
jgi:DNA polymerase III alpha subunit